MKERYTRVFKFEDPIYAKGCPIVIWAGALLKDNQTNGIIGQLKLLNTSSKVVKAVTVEIELYDISENKLEETALKFRYLDLQAGEYEKFGDKTRIDIQNPEVRIIKPKVTSIVFSDNEVVNFEDSSFEVIHKEKLSDSLNEGLIEQYKSDVYAEAQYNPQALDGLWLCTCGEINRIETSSCHACHTKKKKQFLGLDHTQLVKNKKASEEKQAKRNDEIYSEACELMKSDDVCDLKFAIEKFCLIKDWKESNAKKAECYEKCESIRNQQIAEEKKKKIIKISAICGIIVFLIVVLCIGNIIYRQSVIKKITGQTIDRWEGLVSSDHGDVHYARFNDDGTVTFGYAYYKYDSFVPGDIYFHDSAYNYKIKGWYSGTVIVEYEYGDWEYDREYKLGKSGDRYKLWRQ